jgi:hypothetical protein
MVDKVLSELAVSGGPFVLIIDDLHELSSGYWENAWAGVKAHLDTVTEHGRDGKISPAQVRALRGRTVRPLSG